MTRRALTGFGVRVGVHTLMNEKQVKIGSSAIKADLYPRRARAGRCGLPAQNASENTHRAVIGFIRSSEMKNCHCSFPSMHSLLAIYTSAKNSTLINTIDTSQTGKAMKERTCTLCQGATYALGCWTAREETKKKRTSLTACTLTTLLMNGSLTLMLLLRVVLPNREIVLLCTLWGETGGKTTKQTKRNDSGMQIKPKENAACDPMSGSCLWIYWAQRKHSTDGA